MATARLYPAFREHVLGDECRLYAGRLPGPLVPTGAEFESLWAMHPEGYSTIQMPGGPVQLPRYEQAYERAYRFSGLVHRPLPAPPALRAILEWAQGEIDGRLNGILVNWYDGRLGHYIGPHRDSKVGLVPGVPIVTASFGETRSLRLRPWKGKGFKDFPADNGSVYVLPYRTNESWTHEIPKSAAKTGRRVSVTLRAFEEGVGSDANGTAR